MKKLICACLMTLVSLACLFFFVSVTPVNAMTATDFLSYKDENRDIAMYVLGNAEAGGLPELLRQAKDIFEIAKTTPDAVKSAHAKRTAFMHCAFAAHHIRSLPTEEQSQYGNVLISTLAQISESLDMNQDEMFKTLQGASMIYNDILTPAEEDEQPQVFPALFEKYLGYYTYQGDTCAGGLTFSKTGKSGYLISVDNSCESGGTCGGDFEVTPSSENNGVVVLTDVQYGVTFVVGPKGITVGDSLTKNICGMGAYIEGDYVRGKQAPVAQRNSASGSKFDDLIITFITWRGGPYPLTITTKQFISWLAMEGISTSWEEIDQHSQVLHLSAYDKVQKITENYRILFQTKEGAARAMVTRCFFYDSELTGPERDNTFLPLFIAADAEQSQIKK